MSDLVIPTIDTVESSENFGRFVAEPLEKGFGITLGNSLRRVLLSYLPGAAVTRVRIDGVQHEFTVIPNAKEDVMEFLLNIKALRLKPVSGQPGRLTIEASGEKEVHASDIKPSTDFEIANPDLPLVTLNSPEARFYAELDVDLGVGFMPAESDETMSVGTIPVDAIFSPIKKVNFTITPLHIGSEISRERLYLDIWTDGTTSPVDAISNAASILIEQLNPFVDYSKISQMKAEERLIRLSIPDEKYNMPVEQLDLSVRTMNCLRRSGIATVGELIAKGPRELLKLRNFGQKSFQEIEEKLNSMGLSLNPRLEPGEELPEEAEGAEEPTSDTEERIEAETGE